jgi:hypothetical protein
MAETRLSDMIVPSQFHEYTLERTAETSRFRLSGIVADMTDVVADKMAGTTVNLPFFQDLQGDDEIVDDSQDLTISNITTSKDEAAKLFRAKTYGGSDLARVLSGADPVAAIADLFAGWWRRKEQDTLLSVCVGALGSTSMQSNVLDVSSMANGAQFFDEDSFIDACAKLGDRQDDLSGVAVHGDTYKVMKKHDLIDFIKPSEGGMQIPTYMGKLLIVDDKMPKDANGTYTTIVFGPGAIGFAEAAPPHSVEVGREPLRNGGKDYIVQRRYFVMHPRGVRWSPAAGVPAKSTPANAELSSPANWTRVYEAKNIRLIGFKHKLG